MGARMFGRKKIDTQEGKAIMETTDDLGIPGKPASRPGLGLNPPKMPIMPTRQAEAARNDTNRPGIEMPRRADAPAPTAAVAPPAPTGRREASEHRKLIVGREIALS